MTEDECWPARNDHAPADRYELYVEEARTRTCACAFSPPADGWSMAALLTCSETSLRAAAGPRAQLTHLGVTALRDAQAADVLALSRVIRRDGAVIHAEAWLFSHAVVEPMLHVTATLAVPG
jgi:hypothetical protein